MLSANSVRLYIRDFAVLGFGYPRIRASWGVLEPGISVYQTIALLCLHEVQMSNLI